MLRRAAALRIAAVFVLAWVAPASPGFAQVDEGFYAQNFSPPIDPYGYITLGGARALRAGHPFFAASIDWANDPLDLRDVREGRIEQMTFLQAVAAIGVFNLGEGGLDIGLVVPFALHMSGFGRDPNTLTGGASPGRRVDLPDDTRLGDSRVEAKLTLLDRTQFMGIALRGYGMLPTGEDKFFLSNDEKFGAGGGVLVEKQIGFLRAGVEVGYEWIDGDTVLSDETFVDPFTGEADLLKIDDKLHMKLGVATELPIDDLWIVLEGMHFTRAEHLWDNERESPIEVGGALRFDRHVLFLIGGSTRVGTGIGAPDVRAFATVGYKF